MKSFKVLRVDLVETFQQSMTHAFFFFACSAKLKKLKTFSLYIDGTTFKRYIPTMKLKPAR